MTLKKFLRNILPTDELVNEVYGELNDTLQDRIEKVVTKSKIFVTQEASNLFVNKIVEAILEE